MKQFILIIATLLVISQSSKVHEYRAEANFKCTLCQEALKLVQAQDLTQIEAILEKFPMMETIIPILDKYLHDGDKVCHMINFCDDSDDQPESIDHQQHITAVNSAQSTWVAGENAKFTNMKKHEIKAMLGTIVDPELTLKPEYVLPKDFLAGEVPATFDAREAWPKCASVIGHIRDQSNCGSCWAHGTTEAFNDRNCIKNGDLTLLSVSDTTGCCSFLNCFSMGCNGGQVATPWNWFKSTGVVTGGDFGDKTTCYPYTMEQCNHHVTDPSKKDCSDVKQVNPTCSKSCSTGNDADYSKDKHSSSSSYGFSSVDQIKSDLVNYGPVTAAFTVYEDFLSYKSGVYKHTSGSALGGHAVKIVGYGEDHWIVNNSWNDSWGDKGTFKIAFGECGIDSLCHAGQV